MSKFLIIGFLCTSYIFNNFQNRDNDFLSFYKGLQEFKIPFIFSKMIKEVEFNEKEKSFNLQQWKYLITDKKTWPFQKDYYYESYGKITLKNGLTGIIFKRSFLPSDITKEKTEFVLVTLTKAGELISSLPVQGTYGDTINFTGAINQNYEIEINYEIFSFNKTIRKSEVRKKSEKYRLKFSGQIEKHS